MAAQAQAIADEPPTQPLLSQSHKEAFATIADYPTLIHHEESLAKTPYDLKEWWLYLEEIDNLLMTLNMNSKDPTKKKKQNTSSSSPLETVRDLIGRRSVAALPGSYKLWKQHWEFVVRQHAREVVVDSVVLQAFETALRTLHKFPRVWIAYLQFVLGLSSDTGSGSNGSELMQVPLGSTTVRKDTSSSSCSTNRTMMTKTTFLRNLANRALQALPLTQHEDRIWPVLLECWKDDSDMAEFDAVLGLDEDNDNDKHEESPTEIQLRVETRCRLLRRYCMLQPTFRATLCEFYAAHDKWGEAALLYQQMLQQPTSRDTPEYFTWWNALADLCTQHPMEVEAAGVPWEAMVRAAVAMGSSSNAPGDKNSNNNNNNNSTQATVLQEMQGLLWSKLADSWIRRGEFDLARSVLEEGLESVSRVRDFTILFDAYLQFEEGLLEAATEQMEMDENENEEDAEEVVDKDDWDILLGCSNNNAAANAGANSGGDTDGKPNAIQSMVDMELALARAEHLTSRRPILLNRVLLRQNPNNVGEWVARSKLYAKQGEPTMAASALEEALKTVQASRANNGTPSTLVIELAKLYEKRSLAKARDLFDRICNQHEYAFTDPDELAECYAAWVELELRHEAWDDALIIVRGAVAPVSRQAPVRGGKALTLTKSLRLWDLLLDLEESLGTTQTTKDAYNRSLEIKVATPLHILNFCTFLTTHKYFEESFSAFERGLELFAFPHPGAKLLWKSYIEAFNKRYIGTKVERTRDLFQRCLETCPDEESSEFFMVNGAFEEEFGLTKRALSVYGAMSRKVPKDEKFTAYQLYIAKTTKYLGLTATREIYQEAIEALDDSPAAQLCMDFAKMETALQEIDRSRAVLAYGAQMADPRRNPEYWKSWNEFEIAHGNEETFREMLRIKRSVEAAFSTVNYNAAEMSAGAENLSNEEAMNMIASREGVAAPQQNQSTIAGFVKGGKRAAEANLDDVEVRVAKLRKATAASGTTEAASAGNDNNADEDEEIDIDDVDEDDDNDDEKEDEKATPAATAVKDVTTKSVPNAVFGGLAGEAGKEGGDDSAKKGALERLRAAAKSGK